MPSARSALPAQAPNEPAALGLTDNPEANALIAADPFALLVGMVLDQQIPIEWAFTGPLTLNERLGHRATPVAIAAMWESDPQRLTELFCRPPALHRFPAAMAQRVGELAVHIRDNYGGDARVIWASSRTGAELLARVRDLPGFGAHKSAIFVALLAKQLGVRPRGWRTAAGRFAERGWQSVADIVDADTRERVRAAKRAAKAAVAAPAGRLGHSGPA